LNVTRGLPQQVKKSAELSKCALLFVVIRLFQVYCQPQGFEQQSVLDPVIFTISFCHSNYVTSGLQGAFISDLQDYHRNVLLALREMRGVCCAAGSVGELCGCAGTVAVNVKICACLAYAKGLDLWCDGVLAIFIKQ
jgi:hypothetical protein